MSFRPAVELDELWIGEMSAQIIRGKKVLLVRTETSIAAFENRCAHLGVALSEGELEGETLTCAAHGWEYDACTGAGINPRSVCLISYPVRVEGGQILVDVDSGARGTP